MEAAQGKPQRLTASLAWTAAPAVPAGAQLGRRPAQRQVTRPDGSVRQVIRNNCTMRHGIDDYAFFELDRAGCQALLQSMHKDGSRVAEDRRNLLFDWLVARFASETKPFPRTYIPPEITTFFSDPEPGVISIAPARRVIRRLGWSKHVMRKKPGERCWWTCTNVARR